MRKTKVDIIVISYNQELYIRKALESIFIQEVSSDINIRVIIADDFSTDSTLSIIKSLEPYSPFRFEYINSNKNIGLQQNYKRAFELCDSDYTLILEGDDYWCSPMHIMQHIDFLHVHRECSMSVNGIVLYWQEKGVFEFNPREKKGIIYVDIVEQIRWNRIGNFSATCFRTKHLKTMPESMYNYKFADWLVGMIMAQYGFIALLDSYTTIYRKHKGGVWSGSVQANLPMDYELVYKNYSNVLDEKYNSIYEECLAYHKEIELNAIKSNKKNIKDYIPPILLKIYNLFVPTNYK